MEVTRRRQGSSTTYHPLKGLKNHPLSPAWNWADKASHPSSQIPEVREDSLLPGVFTPPIRPNNGTTTCWGLLWCQAQLWPLIHLMSPQEILTA